jgi:hypothetical protein
MLHAVMPMHAVVFVKRVTCPMPLITLARRHRIDASHAPSPRSCYPQAPYDELLCNVKCPEALRFALAKEWSSAPHFRVIVDTITRLAGEDDEDGGDTDDEDPTLFHTLYRYFVLLGLPGQPGMGSQHAMRHLQDNSVWRAAAQLLVPGLVSGVRRRSKHASAAASQFAADQAAFSLACGTAPSMVRARERMGAVPGCARTVLSMLDFVPELRPTMLSVLRSDTFASMRRAAGQNAHGPSAATMYMRFWRADDAGASSLLLNV